MKADELVTSDAERKALELLREVAKAARERPLTLPRIFVRRG